VNDVTEAESAGEGVLAGLLEYLPEGWMERLSGRLGLDPAQVGWLGDESARVGGNLLVLLERGWPGMVATAGRVAFLALAGALLVGLATAVVGWLLYLVAAGPLLRRGWRTGRLIGCFAATAILLCAGAGGAWAGLWLGAGRAIEEAIEEKYVVEKLAAATFLAFTLDDRELPQDVDRETVEGMLEEAQNRSADSWSAFRSRAEATLSDSGLQPPGWLSADLMVGAVGQLAGEGTPDLATLHRVLETTEATTDGSALPQTAEIRKRAVGLLRASVYTQAAMGVGFGLVLPLVGLMLLGLLGSLVHRASPTQAPAENRQA